MIIKLDYNFFLIWTIFICSWAFFVIFRITSWIHNMFHNDKFWVPWVKIWKWSSILLQRQKKWFPVSWNEQQAVFFASQLNLWLQSFQTLSFFQRIIFCDLLIKLLGYFVSKSLVTLRLYSKKLLATDNTDNETTKYFRTVARLGNLFLGKVAKVILQPSLLLLLHKKAQSPRNDFCFKAKTQWEIACHFVTSWFKEFKKTRINSESITRLY